MQMADDIGAQLVTPNPDPSAATHAALNQVSKQHAALVDAQLAIKEAEIQGFRAVIEQRLSAMDKANAVLAENVNRVPTDLQVAVVAVKELNDVKFDGIDSKFEQVDKQTVRESAANTLAVNAAFAAQKESAAATDKANAEAIRKSEAATAETINKLEQLVAGQITSLNEKVDSGKTSVTETRQELIAADAAFRVEMTASLNSVRTELVQLTSKTAGVRESRGDTENSISAAQASATQRRESLLAMLSVFSAVMVVITIGVAIYAALKV